MKYMSKQIHLSIIMNFTELEIKKTFYILYIIIYLSILFINIFISYLTRLVRIHFFYFMQYILCYFYLRSIHRHLLFYRIHLIINLYS